MKFEMCLPILGFENIKEVTLEKIDDNFMKMTPVGDEYISFTLVNPFALKQYDFEIPTQMQEMLGINDDSNLIVLNIILIQTPPGDSIVNFIGPLVFNTDNKKAAQIVLQESPQNSVAEKVSELLTDAKD
jgi:flagellar assembly factor FliW